MASNGVLESVRPLLPAIAERAGATDENRVVPGESVRELRAAGFFRMLQPKRYGGAESDPVHFYEVVREVSGACASTGWVASVLGVHAWQLGLFPERAQDEVWGPGPDTLISSSYAPVGKLTPVDGGYSSVAAGVSPRAATTPRGRCWARCWWAPRASRSTS